MQVAGPAAPIMLPHIEAVQRDVLLKRQPHAEIISVATPGMVAPVVVDFAREVGRDLVVMNGQRPLDLEAVTVLPENDPVEVSQVPAVAIAQHQASAERHTYCRVEREPMLPRMPGRSRVR